MAEDKRSRHDETGLRLIRAGAHLLRTGTPIEELRLKDAAMLANLTVGAAYPRFPSGQEEFRREVVSAVLRESPKHRDAALDAIAQSVSRLRAKPLTVKDIPQVINAVAGQQQDAIRNDQTLNVRLYALSRLALGDHDDDLGEVRRELSEYDQRMAEEWRGTLEVICGELGIEPADETVSLNDFELACSSLLMGLAVRQQTSDLPKDIYPKLVMALAAGFFDVKAPATSERRAHRGFGIRLIDKLKRKREEPLTRSREKLKELAVSPRPPGLGEISMSQDELIGQLASEPVKRALKSSGR